VLFGAQFCSKVRNLYWYHDSDFCSLRIPRSYSDPSPSGNHWGPQTCPQEGPDTMCVQPWDPLTVSCFLLLESRRSESLQNHGPSEEGFTHETSHALSDWKKKRLFDKKMDWRQNCESAVLFLPVLKLGFPVFLSLQGQMRATVLKKKNASRLCGCCLFSNVDFLVFLVSRNKCELPYWKTNRE
jgi:hypothetical protein